MDEAEDAGVARVLHQRLETRLVVVHVLFQLPALDVEHIDQHLDVVEDVVALARKVVLHERLLPDGAHDSVDLVRRSIIIDFLAGVYAG